MHLQETILCATAPHDSSQGAGVISIHDIQTGSPLASFKQTNAGVHCTCFVETRDGQGGFVLAAQSEKSILNAYSFQKDQVAMKIVLPEKMSCIAVDHSGHFCAAGTNQGRIYLWEVASGIMYNSWDAHYRRLTVLRFTHDGSALLSGSEDSGVSAWSVSRLVDDVSQNDIPTPYCLLSDHTLPITDIVCGIGAFPTCRVLTASVDHSVKLWDMSSRSLLTTFQFPKPISCLAWDATERLFFAASSDGSIHQVNLFRQRTDNFGGRTIEAVGGAGVSDVVRLEVEDEKTRRQRLISVGHEVTTLTFNLSSSLLLVGTADGLINIYDIASHQLLRTISTHKDMVVSYLATLLKPPDLIGHISFSMNVTGSADAKDILPMRPVVLFQRTRDLKSRRAHEVSMVLPSRHEKSYALPASYDYTSSEFLRDHSFFVQPSDTESTAVTLQSRVTELEGEVVNLREQLGKAKSINDAMWETVVHRVFVKDEDKEKTGTSKMVDQVIATSDGVEGEKARKRGKR